MYLWNQKRVYSLLSAPIVLCLCTPALAGRTLADLENVDSAPSTQVIIPQRTQTTHVSQAEIQHVDQEIFKRMMTLAKSSKAPAVINAYIDIANKIKLKSNGALTEQALLESRMEFYQSLLASMNPSEITDDLYYEVASTQDLLGHSKESIAALRQLLARFPQSKYALEAKFRVAEESFSTRSYAEAANFYRTAISAGNTKYLLQAQYGLGWSLYKDGRSEEAVAQFETLLSALKAKTERSKGENILFNDCYKTIALVFVQMGGAPALSAYYANKPLTPDEVLTHQNVANKYIELKQPFDVAKVYESFIQRRALAPEVLLFSNQLIKVYEDAGFAQDIIRAKTDFVTRFSVNGPYFEQAPRTVQEQLTKDLRTHLTTLAKHYHAVAQQNKQPESYKKPAALYKELLSLIDNNAPEYKDTEELLAGTLYESQQYQAAIPYFEDLAYTHPSKTAVDNAYFVLLSYQALRKGQSGSAYLDLLSKEKDSSIAYAKAFPADKNTFNILDHLTDEYLKLKQFDTLIMLSNLKLALPTLTALQRKDTYSLLADTQFDNRQWKAAEQAYNEVLRYANLSPSDKTRNLNQLAATYYQQAKDAASTGNKTEASKLYNMASNTSLDDNVKSNAAFQAINLVGDAPEALPMLQSFYKKYPNHELSQGILERILAIQESPALKDYAGASNTYVQIYQRDYTTKHSNALAALWLAAESAGKTSATDYSSKNLRLNTTEAELYKKYISEKEAPLGQQLVAYERLYLDAVTQNNLALQTQYLNTHWNLYQTYKASAAGDALANLTRMAARARITLDAPLVTQYKALPLTQPLKASIATKMAALQNVIKSQQAILDLKVAEYFTQAQYTLGDSYTNFYTGVANAPKPAGLDELALEQYSIAIEEQTQPLKDKAVDFHKLNVDVALKHRADGLWDQWIGKSFDAMAEISPGKFARPIPPPTVLADDIALSQLLVSLKPTATVIFGNADYTAKFLTSLDSLISTRLEQFKGKTYARANASDKLKIMQMLSNALYYKAYVQTEQGQFNDALSTLSIALNTNPQFKEAMLLQGAINDLYLDQSQVALGVYQRVNALDPDNMTVQKWINIAQKKLGIPLTNYKKATAPAPTDNTPANTAVETTAAAVPELKTPTPPHLTDTQPAIVTPVNNSSNKNTRFAVSPTQPSPSTATVPSLQQPTTSGDSRFAIKPAGQ